MQDSFEDMVSKGPRSLMKRVSTQCRDAASIDIWFDCMVFSNPNTSKCGHIGEHLDILYNLTDSPEFEDGLDS